MKTAPGRKEIVIVGGTGGTNVGESFLRAAQSLGLSSTLMDASGASGLSGFWDKFSWHFLGHRPSRLREFSRSVLESCPSDAPFYLLTTGLAPVRAQELRAARERGGAVVNFLTDDPWNRTHGSRWFLKALPEYDTIFTPRRANIDDLKILGCREVVYLPFGVAPEHFFPCAPQQEFESDVAFAGGADEGRARAIGCLARAGFKVGLYGSYWEQYAETARLTRGRADSRTVRIVIASAKIALCLVRKSNRDGHSMRTFEIPAVGTFMLTEDTAEHRELFGSEGVHTLYFKTAEEMTRKASWALEHEQERRRMAGSAHALIVSGKHAYADRLSSILGACGK